MDASRDVTLTMLPPPRSAIALPAAWSIHSAPKKLVSNRSRTSATGVSSTEPVWSSPALLTSTCGPPHSPAASTTSCTVSRSATLPATKRACSAPPSASTSRAPASGRRPTPTTRAPSTIRRPAIASPMPALAPVTIATLPSSRLTSVTAVRLVDHLGSPASGAKRRPLFAELVRDLVKGGLEHVGGDHQRRRDLKSMPEEVADQHTVLARATRDALAEVGGRLPRARAELDTGEETDGANLVDKGVVLERAKPLAQHGLQGAYTLVQPFALQDVEVRQRDRAGRRVP